MSVIDSINFRENCLIFLGNWGEAELILGTWGAKENIFRELRYFLSGSWGDQCIIFRDPGSTDPPGALYIVELNDQLPVRGRLMLTCKVPKRSKTIVKGIP